MQIQSILPLELSAILDDMNKCIDNGIYYPALLVALTLPEICAAMELHRSINVKDKHYIPFIEKYALPYGLGLNGTSCYRMRGGLVHRASLARHPKADFTHVIFTIPETKNSVHGIVLNMNGKQAVMLDLITFCKTMDAAVRRWFHEKRNDLLVQENIRHIIRYCPFGLSPFFEGAPIVGAGE